MNAKRRKLIEEVYGKLEELKASMETLRDEERECYDNMPEGLQSGENGSKVDEAANCLESACDSQDEVMNYLMESIGS